MSAFGGKADIILGVAKSPLIAISGHSEYILEVPWTTISEPIRRRLLYRRMAALLARDLISFGR